MGQPERSVPCEVPRVLAVAGSDSGGGAGIQADQKTCFALGVHLTAAVTAVTAQDGEGVAAVYPLPPEAVTAQMEAAARLGVHAVKTGMLWSAAIVEAVAEAVSALRLPNLVVDPVLAAGTGAPLLEEAARGPLLERLFPLALAVTPNVPEAEALAGLPIRDEVDLRRAAHRLRALGPRWVVVTGGHLPGGRDALDLLYDGEAFYELRGERLPVGPVHGAGCTFSSALAAGLARGLPVPEAARLAKDYTASAIRHRLALGPGRPSVNHWGNRWFAYGRTSA